MTYACKCCGEEKEKEAFSVHKQCVVGLDLSRCKECKKDFTRAANKWASRTTEQRILNRVKTRAKARDIPFDLELDDIVVPDVCPVLGMPFIYGDHDWTYSLDRIKPELGYVKGNVIVMSNRANMIKSTATTEEVGRLYAWMLSMEES